MALAVDKTNTNFIRHADGTMFNVSSVASVHVDGVFFVVTFHSGGTRVKKCASEDEALSYLAAWQAYLTAVVTTIDADLPQLVSISPTTYPITTKPFVITAYGHNFDTTGLITLNNFSPDAVFTNTYLNANYIQVSVNWTTAPTTDALYDVNYSDTPHGAAYRQLLAAFLFTSN